MQNKFMELVEQSSMKATVPKFEIGDTVDVHVRILEGEKERIQIFNGVVIARSGTKTREMFVVRRIVQGEGVERKFPIHSPRIADIVVKRSGVVRRAKLYFLRERTGKAVRLKERFPTAAASPAEAKAAKAERRAVRAAKKAAKAVAAAAGKAASAVASAASSAVETVTGSETKES
jgi:large subunit ribosomal protein L19